ncbi:MAG: protein kinase [Myxococcales bacterium]|nr:protein kinase [Myxococcales bacterium]
MGVGSYAAYDPELDRKVALKLLRPEHTRAGTSGEDARTRLLREAQALARLSHPNVVAIHDVGEHHDSVWLAMELVDGRTLKTWLKERVRGWREVLEVIGAAGRGLAAAHAAELLHRDFKPDFTRDAPRTLPTPRSTRFRRSGEGFRGFPQIGRDR